uniref:suppressor protein SRP40-like n=1 Tax=Erigeron canadensis TaxID=72917 RepID=UPI001CB8BFF1|nr:suppressor protein SRP40-like [Erigeron canadensis]
MGEIENMKIFQEMAFKRDVDKSQPGLVQWVLIEPKDESVCKYDLVDSDLDDSFESSSSSSSSDTIDDVSSSSSSSSSTSLSSSSNSPLFKLSELMAQLPIKKGLSRFYHGKSESFASLNDVENIEDLAKKRNYFCRSRSRKSHVDGQKRLSPKATIAKNKKSPSCSTTGVVGYILHQKK